MYGPAPVLESLDVVNWKSAYARLVPNISATARATPSEIRNFIENLSFLEIFRHVWEGSTGVSKTSDCRSLFREIAASGQLDAGHTSSRSGSDARRPSRRA